MRKPSRGTVMIAVGLVLLAGSGAGGWAATGHHTPHVSAPWHHAAEATRLDPYGIADEALWHSLEVPDRYPRLHIAVLHLNEVRRDGTVPTAGEVADTFLAALDTETATDLGIDQSRRERVARNGMTYEFLTDRIMDMEGKYHDRQQRLTELITEATMRAQVETDSAHRAEIIQSAKSEAEVEPKFLENDLLRVGWTLAAGEKGVTRMTPSTDNPWVIRDGHSSRLHPVPAPWERPFPSQDAGISAPSTPQLGAPGSPLLGAPDANLVRPPGK